jgi:hypothetical protein
MNRKVKENDLIKLPHGNVSKLAEDVGVSVSTVNSALKGVKAMSDTTYENIRSKAMNFYGGRILL